MAFFTLADLVGTVIGLGLTLMVFSYLFGDNPAFRSAVHLFIGVSAGLASAVVLRNVILPQIILPLLNFGDGLAWLWSLGLLVFAALLLTKLSPRFRRLGNLPMAFIVGAGAAAAVGGAVLGTLFPQIEASAGLFDLTSFTGQTPFDGFLGFINRGIVVIGTLATLSYFHFGARSVPNAPAVRNQAVEASASVGQVFIAVTFGALFAGVFSAALVALIERIGTFFGFIEAILGLF